MNIKNKNSLRLSRRSFLKHSGTAVAGGMLLTRLETHLAKAMEEAADSSYTFRLVRDLDLLQAEIRFIRFKQYIDCQEPYMEPDGFGDSLVAIRLPPQNLAEAIFDEVHQNADTLENDDLPVTSQPGDASQEGINNPTPPIQSFLSGPSWLVYVIPNKIKFPLNNVERWFEILATCDLNVPRGALPPDKRGSYQPTPPGLEETRLEVPFRLFISPEPEIRTIFSGLNRSSDNNPYQEMWQAALESRLEVHPAPPPPGMPDQNNVPDSGDLSDLNPPKEVVLHARAVWSPDYSKNGEPPFSLYYPAFQPLSLHALTRHRLVEQMGEGDGWIDAEYLILTALGADTSLSYASQKPVSAIIKEQIDAARGNGTSPQPGTELRLWKHRIVVGRDVFFAEAYFGFLFPFTFPAVYVEITKRKPARPAGQEQFGYYLLKRRFILVQEPAKNFLAGHPPSVDQQLQDANAGYPPPPVESTHPAGHPPLLAAAPTNLRGSRDHCR